MALKPDLPQLRTFAFAIVRGLVVFGAECCFPVAHENCARIAAVGEHETLAGDEQRAHSAAAPVCGRDALEFYAQTFVRLSESAHDRLAESLVLVPFVFALL